MSLKRKTGVYCECGIKCNEVQPGVWECPRCRKVVEKEEEPKTVLRGEFQTAPAMTHPGRVYPKGEYKLADKEAKLNNPTPMAACMQCGAVIEDKCGAVCPKCNFVNPCKTEK